MRQALNGKRTGTRNYNKKKRWQSSWRFERKMKAWTLAKYFGKLAMFLIIVFFFFTGSWRFSLNELDLLDKTENRPARNFTATFFLFHILVNKVMETHDKSIILYLFNHKIVYLISIYEFWFNPNESYICIFPRFMVKEGCSEWLCSYVVCIDRAKLSVKTNILLSMFSSSWINISLESI